jgi:hypothetical protein
MTTGGEARFEFRVWADRLDDIAARLRSMSEPLEVRESRETYFVSTASVDANPKARTELLDIKTLVVTHEEFEQWEVRLKAEFPVDASVLRNELFPVLGVAPPLLERDGYTLTQLLDELVTPHPELAAVEVTKRREMHAIKGCIAEITQATIAGDARQTVAIESIDLDDLYEARRALGLDDHDNVSYPRAIRNALGAPFALD